MTCDFTSFLTVVQSYQDNERLSAVIYLLRLPTWTEKPVNARKSDTREPYIPKFEDTSSYKDILGFVTWLK